MEAWVVARADNDYAAFRPWLDRHLELKREYIACFDAPDDPYDVLLDDFEPGTTTAEVRAVFDRLKEELVPLIAATADDGRRASATGPFPEDGQRAIGVAVDDAPSASTSCSFRLDSTVHPFCSVVRDDRRPRDDAVRRDTTSSRCSAACTRSATASTSAASARRSSAPRSPRAARRACTRARAGSGRTWSAARCRSAAGSTRSSSRRSPTHSEHSRPSELHAAVNCVQPSYIRVDADEVTYGMHIILRFELEQELIAGTLSTADLPEAWNARFEEYLGIPVPTTGSACSRTCTGRPASSATSRPTSSAT